MKKYLVRFITKDGDYDKEWCYADSPEDAGLQLEAEHWNIGRITDVSEI